MACEETLTATAWTDLAVLRFQTVANANPFGLIESPLELLNQSYLHVYQFNNQAALIALKRESFANGIRVHVQGLVALPHSAPLQLRHVMMSIENQALVYGADVLTMCTHHAALAAGATRWGGHISGAVLSKKIKGQ